ncbi:hypothetical protein [Consotaella aegiceratis]|uniref:hypothetical protein n=1 Tax=Consotaella aegiceratis TaxID=3097961 RepID=UPI002F40C862
MSRLNPEEARQGKKGTPILIILVVALALMALGFIGMGIYGWVMPDEDLGTGVTSDADTAPAATSSDGETEVTPAESRETPGAAPETAN